MAVAATATAAAEEEAVVVVMTEAAEVAVELAKVAELTVEVAVELAKVAEMAAWRWQWRWQCRLDRPMKVGPTAVWPPAGLRTKVPSLRVDDL